MDTTYGRSHGSENRAQHISTELVQMVPTSNKHRPTYLQISFATSHRKGNNVPSIYCIYASSSPLLGTRVARGVIRYNRQGTQPQKGCLFRAGVYEPACSTPSPRQPQAIFKAQLSILGLEYMVQLRLPDHINPHPVTWCVGSLAFPFHSASSGTRSASGGAASATLRALCAFCDADMERVPCVQLRVCLRVSIFRRSDKY